MSALDAQAVQDGDRFVPVDDPPRLLRPWDRIAEVRPLALR